MDKIERIFPNYFSRFTLPEGARDQTILVHRACKTRRCDRESFLPSFEEKGFQYDLNDDPSDPGLYSLSVYEKPKDVKRFLALTNEFDEPYVIARGYTSPIHGLCQRTKERKKCSSSHVDWWLYEKASPYEEFCVIENFDQYLMDFKNGKF